jgi:hypothetical protein
VARGDSAVPSLLPESTTTISSAKRRLRGRARGRLAALRVMRTAESADCGAFKCVEWKCAVESALTILIRPPCKSPKVALITGITGQDGAYLAELLLRRAT